MARTLCRFILALFYGAAGVLHLMQPRPFLSITPHWVPFPALVILLTGIAELAGAAALIQPFSTPLRRAAAIGLALYAVCVFPANINHMMMDMAKPVPDLGWSYHIPRMVFQPFVIWLALWAGGVTDWPFRRSSPLR
jgi:uncharacterized membrane protein